MRLHICWSTNGSHHHDCHKAHQALTDAGHTPEIVEARGQEHLQTFLQSRVRREVHALTNVRRREGCVSLGQPWRGRVSHGQR